MERFGRWIPEERIGVGGVADVWRATCPEDGRTAALKILREPDRSPAHRDRFLREGRLLQRLSSPGLPRIYEVGTKPQPYLAIELLEGETLSERIRSQGPMVAAEVEKLAHGLLEVLAMLHARGVVHRDIKASNIFLSDDNRVMLLDLGLAADAQDPLITTLGDVMGTYAYMAPEQIAGAEVDHRCDLYSLGITLYEAVAGVRPFHAQDAAGYLRAHREGRAPPLLERRPDAPVRLVDTISRMMARDPAARPASAPVASVMLMGSGGVRRSLGAAPLVGRAAAIGSIEAILDGGGMVAVLGETGSGTGRIADHALSLARERGYETVALRCYRRSSPLDPLHQLARDLGQILGAPVDHSVPSLVQAVGDLAAEGALFVLLEDAEQCSAEAAAALARIIRPTRGLAVLVTGADTPPGLQAHIVHLRPLTQGEVVELVAGMLGSRAVPAGLGEQLHRISGGLPSVVVLAVRDLVARGALRYIGVSDEGDSTWHLDRSAAIVPTLGLARLFGDTLLRLPVESQLLLEILAISGESLPLRAALEAAGSDASGLASGPLVTEGFAQIERQSSGEWIVLRRPAIGALILSQTTEIRQADLHRTLARVLSRLPRDAWRDERVAWHTAHGAQPEAAAEALRALGERLLASGQPARALEVLGRASTQAHTLLGTSAAIAVARGEALSAVGRREDASATLRAGLELARSALDESLVARALVAMAELHLEIRDAEGSLPLAEQALELLAERPDDPSRPRALLAAANGYRVGAEPDLAAARYHQCIDEGLAQGHREYAAMAHGGLGLLLAEASGRLEDAVRHLEQEAAFLRSRTLPSRLVVTLYRLSQVHLRIGDVRAALEVLDEAEALSRVAELPYERAMSEVGRASVMLEVGDHEAARRLLRSARAALEPEANPTLRLAYRLVQGELRMRRGDNQSALATYQAAETEAAEAGFVALGAFCLGMAGVLTADAEGLTRAMDVLGRSGDLSLTAKLLLHGGRVGGDADVLRSAEAEARKSRDRFVLLSVLHAVGGDDARKEGHALVQWIDSHLPSGLRGAFLRNPAVRWVRRQVDTSVSAG